MLKTTMKYAVSLLFLMISLAYAQKAPEMAVTDPHKPIIVSKKSPVFKITLPSNPTTGFSWFIKTYNPQFIEVLAAKFTPPTQAIPGRGGVSTWTFQATIPALRVPTLTTITLVYARPWAVNEGTEQTFTIVTQ